MTTLRPPSPGRLRRLAEELADEGFTLQGEALWCELVLTELDYALRPPVHEHRIPSFGSFVDPSIDIDAWQEPTQLTIARRRVETLPLADARRFADGLASWLVRRTHGSNELVVFDRAAGSERDMVILARASGAALVQRHPRGWVRLVGPFGVLRWDGVGWHHEPPVDEWIDRVSECDDGDHDVLAQLLAFAVHDLGARGIGALLVYRPVDDDDATFQLRLPEPPPLEIGRPSDLAPLGHVLAQVDGAAVFDVDGTLRQLGVRLVPSAEAESDIEGFRGMRHTSGRRYSFDDTRATVIVVSEDGPVTVWRNGELVGRTE
jgi:hypothetical protein